MKHIFHGVPSYFRSNCTLCLEKTEVLFAESNEGVNCLCKQVATSSTPPPVHAQASPQVSPNLRSFTADKVPCTSVILNAIVMQ